MAKGTEKSPGGAASAGENAKSEDSLIPARKPGQDPDDVAERMGTTGAGLGVSPKPTGG